MKTIYINESTYKLLQESILLDNIPEDVMNIILQDKTSLRNNPAIPNIFEEKFLEKMAKKQFLSVKETLKKIGTIDDFDDDKIDSVLGKLILKAQKIEQQNKNELEKICHNYITNFFGVPEDSVTMDLQLTENIEESDINIDPIDTIDTDFEDIKTIEELNGEVAKKRLLNTLSMGAALQISSDIKSYVSDIYDIDSRLPDLYKKIIALNNYLLFTKDDLGINDENKMLLGSVNVVLGKPDESPVIKAQGKIFPVLLSETIRGFMELFASHGLPKEKEKIDYVLNKTDYIKAEPWDMRLGPQLWIMLSNAFDKVDSDLIPYLYRRIAMLSTKNFNKMMSELFAGTHTGKKMLNILTQKARKEKEYNSFVDKISALQTDKNIINDEYIHVEEL